MDSYQPQVMLVTGGAGFIGMNFIHHVLTNEPTIRIINLDKLIYSSSSDHLTHLPTTERHHFIEGDITDKMFIRHILQHHHIDTIVHFAAETLVDRSIASPSSFVESNIMGTFTLLEAARHHWFEIEECDPSHCRFHHISTDEVYGSLSAKDPLFTENSPYHPRSPYAATKGSADHLVYAYHHTYGLPITLSRSSNNYGPYQHEEKFIPTVIRACLNSKPIPIYGNGENIRDWLYVDDHCHGILSIIKQGKVGEHYNMGGNNEWKNIALARYICEQMDDLMPRKESCTSLIKLVDDRKGHDFRHAIDDTKMKREFGWSPKTSLEDGMKKTIEFYLAKTH